MISWTKIKELFINAIKTGTSPHKLALSFSIGMYIAWCPFIGLHTIMMFAALWLFSLNFPALLCAAAINNPWTMLGICSSEYAFGYWFVHNVLSWNPEWALSMEKIFGYGKICIWSFFIGSNIIGIVSALVSYAIIFFACNTFSKNNRHIDNTFNSNS